MEARDCIRECTTSGRDVEKLRSPLDNSRGSEKQLHVLADFREFAGGGGFFERMAELE